MSKAIANVRAIRKRGKSKLAGISDQLNNLAWDLSEKNEKIGDAHTAKSIAMLDESLSLMQRALGLMNSVSVDRDMLVQDDKPAKSSEKKISGGLFSKKSADVKEVPTADKTAADVTASAPIASIKPQA